MNYQGDLNPNSFTLAHSGPASGLIIKKTLSRWFTLRAAFVSGKIQAADKWNRDDLKARNLSFATTITEASAGLEVTLLDMSVARISPYMYGGMGLFHFNPWTTDRHNTKVFLQPLSTEGQGLSEYPEQKVYKLTQMSLAFGAGLKYAVSNGLTINLEFSQRKTFTDYLDDVSSHFVDPDILRQARGEVAVELAYRGDEVPNGRLLFPTHGDQRGTPTEMDWYYYTGISAEINLNTLGSIFSSSDRKALSSQRCPKNLY